MQNILVIRLSAIGDIILASAPLLNLKICRPEAKIYFLTKEKYLETASLLAGADEIIPFPNDSGIFSLYRTAENLDKIGFEAVVDLHGNFRAHFISHHLAGLKSHYPKRRWERLRATFRGNRKFIKFEPPHSIDLYNEAITNLGCRIAARRPVVSIPHAVNSRDFPDEIHPVIAIAPGASFPTKQWFPERFERLAVKIYQEFKAGIILYLTDSDRDLERLREVIPDSHLRIHMNSSLPALAESLSSAEMLISNDSALAHLGSAVGTPVLTLFGPTHPTLGFSPRGLRDHVIQVDEYCRPCSLHGRRRCFRDAQYCFTRISVEDVFILAAEGLKSNLKGDRAIFIDRDGTLIKEKEFIRDPAEVEPEDGAFEAVRLANEAGYKVIVISNQSGVARGYFPEETVQKINERVKSLFRQEGALVDDILYCPHLPKGSVREYCRECQCRKPAPGMIERACLTHNINPFRSAIIGDKISDIELSYVSGARSILVRTGYGVREEEKLGLKNHLRPEFIADNILEGVKYLLKK